MRHLKNLIKQRMKLLAGLVAAFAIAAILIPVAALADVQAFPVPEGDVAAILLSLATNYKTLGVLGIVSALTVISVQAVKAWVPEQWQYKRLMTLVMSIAYSVISGLLVPGSNAVSVIITVFLSSGGAVALYEGLKGAGIIKAS